MSEEWGTCHIVFLEPTESGSFFDAEIMFGACDGDEREAKRVAYQMMLKNKNLKLVKEIANDETCFELDSYDDFVSNMTPSKNLPDIEKFLEQNDYRLKAQRRINIFEITKS